MPRFGISIYGVSRKIRTGELTPISAFERICDMGAECVEPMVKHLTSRMAIGG